MTFVVVGLDHRSTSLETLGRISIDAGFTPYVLELILKSEHITEAVVVSTCMRTEVYVEAIRFHGAVDHILDVLAETRDVSPELFDQRIELHDDEALAHLFRVAAGLESAVLGESEVLGQIARAWSAAREFKAARMSLGEVFRHAITVGRRARCETAIGQGSTSIAEIAVEVAATAFEGGLADRAALVVGAGDMGRRMATSIAKRGAAAVTVANRDLKRAAGVADALVGQPVASATLAEIPRLLTEVDVVCSSTASSSPLVTAEHLRVAMAARADRPLVVVDLGSPADVEPAGGALDGVTLIDLDGVRRRASAGHAFRADAIGPVEALVAEQLRAYHLDVDARSVVPVIRALRDEAEALRQQQLQRSERLLRGLTAQQRQDVDALTGALVARLLHEPTVRLKAVAGTAAGDQMAAALRHLFRI